MKNNIRYKGNINNISQWCYFAWENLQWGFCDVGCSYSFNLLLFFIFVVALHSLLFNVIPHPSVDYCRVLTLILYFQPSPSQSDSRHLYFNLSEIFFHSFTASATVLSGYFLPTSVFYLTFLHRHFTCTYQGFPGSRQFFLEFCRASYWSSKHRPSPSVCLINSNPQSSYSARFIFKFYQTLSWITCGESLVYLLLTRLELFSLVQSDM